MSRFKSIYQRLAVTVIATIALAGCIKNNIPYPHINVNFTTFEVENSLRATAIDTLQRKVTVYLNERADINNVIVNGFTLSPSTGVWADSAMYLNGIDMSSPLTTQLSLYHDYEWTITAIQEIERYFTVEQQIGSSVIDVPGCRVIAYVSSSAPLANLLVKSIKLGPSVATMTPEISGKRVDFTRLLEVDVTAHGRTSKWSIYVLPKEESVTTERVDAWSCVAWLYGAGEAGKDNGFEYHKADSDSWIKLSESQITADGGSFVGRLTGLQPTTSYVARAYSGADYGAEVSFTTQGTAQMPNSDFENWWLDGKVWDPWAEGGERYWDTGNKGATTLGSSNTYPSDDTPDGNGRSACLETRFVGVGVIGKLAAGNIFAGEYVKTDGTNGILSFGRPWNLRPTRLRGWFKYHSAPISNVSSDFDADKLKGTPDTGIVWIALIDSDEPFEIRTNPKNRQLFDPEGQEVVAYGKAEWSKDVTDWTQFEITLDYKSTQRVPKYLLCTASASSLGDYFTGGNGSILMLDNFELMFDY